MPRFHAMNTEVTFAVPGLEPGAERALGRELAALFEDAEQRFSRFRPSSELSRLNRATAPFHCSRELIDALVAARDRFVESGGLFDPAIGGALEAAGYDRSFAPGALDRSSALPAVAAAPARFVDLAIDVAERTVVRPAGLTIDLGGIVKGRTVDRAAARLPAPGFVEAGGDAALVGSDPGGEGWLVDVEDPADEERVLATLRVSARAVATSAPNRRRWRIGAASAHHLVDPRTGAPARSDLAQVTALAPTAEEAEVLAKVAFLLGSTEGATFLDRRPGVGGVLVTNDGSARFVGDVEVHDA